MQNAELFEDWEERYVLLADEYANLTKEHESLKSSTELLRILYHKANDVLCEVGVNGEITTMSDSFSNLMDAFHEIDRGTYDKDL